jgi:hypothetical protein
MNDGGIYSWLVVGVCTALAAGSGCAGDDAKIVVGDGGAAGEAGEAAVDAGGTQASGAGASAGGASAGGAGNGGSAISEGGSAISEGGGAVSAGGSALGGDGAGETNGGSGAETSSAGSDNSGTGGADEGTPVPSACLGCGSDFCVAARVACQNDPECVSCRDENYRTLACAQNANFTGWVTCICDTGCSAVCSALCAG